MPDAGRAVPWTLGLAIATAVGMGLLVAATSPLLPALALVAIGVFVAVLRRPYLGVGLFVAITAVLPFGVIPLPLAGAQLTFVDAVLIASYTAVLGHVLVGGLKLRFDAPAVALVCFVAVAVAAFVAGSTSGGATPELIRRFGKLLAGLLVFVLARALVTTQDRLSSLVRWLIVAGAVQGAIGTALMALSPLAQLTILTRLQVIGYPTSDVLRYVPGANNTYTNQLRAIGTSVDPNVFGGTVMLALALILVQWAAPKPVVRRSLLLVLAIPAATGMLLSLSRASWLGLAVGLGLIGAIRYRRILVLGLVAGLALLVTPRGQEVVARFVSGLSTADRATAFRVGEYSNALTLLQRYPILGIGFGQSPDIDVSAGVSSVYLLVAEQTGFVGLTLFGLAVLLVWTRGLRGLGEMHDVRLQGSRAALLAAMTAALVAGLLDHYFANQSFPHAVGLFWLYAAALVASAELAAVSARKREPERAAQPRAATLGAHRAPV